MAIILRAGMINDLPAIKNEKDAKRKRRDVYLRHAVFCLLGLLTLLLAPGARADCYFSSGSHQQFIVYGPASIGIPRDAVNTIVLQTSMVSPTGPMIVTCDGSNSIGTVNSVGPAQSVLPFTFYDNSAVSWQFSWDYSGLPVNPWPYYTLTDTAYNPGAYSGGVQIVLKGSLTQPYTVKAGTLGYYRSGSLNVFDIVLGRDIYLYPLQCVPTVKNIEVKLGKHSQSELPSIASTTTPVDFSIGLTGCTSGVSVSYQIDPETTVVSSTDSVVKLDASSTASGVGVQLFNAAGTAPFKLSNKVSIGTLSGSYDIPLKARYYRTDATMNPGTANSSMTFTMTYQ